MTTEPTTAPLCRCCHKPRRRRAGQQGYTGAHDWCEGCYSRWLKAGRPPEGPPPPMTASQSAALANAVQRKAKEPASMSRSLAALSWYGRAGCDGMDTDLFFPLGTTAEDDKAKIAIAKAACARCPVRVDCLDFAIATGQKGVWGGLNEDERANERRRRNRRVAVEETAA